MALDQPDGGFTRPDGWRGILADLPGDDAVVVADPTFTIRAVSDPAAALLELDPSQFVGQPVTAALHPGDIERATAVLEDLRSEPYLPPGLFRLRRGSSHRSFAVAVEAIDSAVVFRIAEPTATQRAESLANEVVESMELLSSEQSLDDSLHALTQLAARHTDGVALCVTYFVEDDHDARVVADESVAPDVFDRNAATTRANLPVNVRAAMAEQDIGSARRFDRRGIFEQLDEKSWITSVLLGPADHLLGYVEVLRSDTAPPSPQEWTVHALVVRMATLLIDRDRRERQLTHAAEHDPLTGLANRRLLTDAVDKALETTEEFGVLVMDLDRFSEVNNALGHFVGDRILVAAANGLRRACPADAVISRFGGDEFVVLLPSATSLEDLRAIAAGLEASLAETEHLPDRRSKIRASVGVALRGPRSSATEVIAAADRAMYEAKRAGGDQYSLAECA